jgi:hypothetical protein
MNRVPWIAAGIAVVLAGCGSGGDSSSDVSTTSTSTTADAAIPEPAQPIDELVSALDQLNGQSTCKQALESINPIVLPDPDGGASARNCDGTGTLLGLLGAFEPTESAEFGTGAVIDGTNRGHPVALTAALDDTKNFKLTGITVNRAQIGTEPSAEADFEAPAAAFVEAVRDEDCKTAHSVLAPYSRLAYADEKQFCSIFDDNFMTAPDGLGVRLQEDPDAELVDLGGTHDEHFYGLPTTPAGYRTFMVSTIGSNDTAISEVMPVER